MNASGKTSKDSPKMEAHETEEERKPEEDVR